MTTTDELEHRNARLLASALARIEALEVVYGKRLEAHAEALEALVQRVDALTAAVEHAADRLGTVEVRLNVALRDLETVATDQRHSRVIGVSPVRR